MLANNSNLRCADCGSSDVVLEGQGLWDKAAQSWIIPAPDMEDVNGVLHPQDDTANFFCRICGDGVSVNAGQLKFTSGRHN